MLKCILDLVVDENLLSRSSLSNLNYAELMWYCATPSYTIRVAGSLLRPVVCPSGYGVNPFHYTYASSMSYKNQCQNKYWRIPFPRGLSVDFSISLSYHKLKITEKLSSR